VITLLPDPILGEYIVLYLHQARTSGYGILGKLDSLFLHHRAKSQRPQWMVSGSIRF
jgi:hypothetical protein